MQNRFARAFEAARAKHKLHPSYDIAIHESSLAALPASVTYDLVVSPANSYARLDGAFDDAISRAFSPRDDYLALTRHAQGIVYRKYRGFAPPGTCTLIPFAFEPGATKNVWGCRYVALCPTMRVPANVCWDREIVYECVWSLLCALDNHNNDDAVKPADKITSILMTPLATGVGLVSPQKWAEQAVLAMNHYAEAVEKPEKWSRLEFHDVYRDCWKVGETHDL